MGHYIISFTVYTLAMCGLIFFALFVYKKVMCGNIIKNKTKQLSIEETLSINPRKSLMIVRAGEERFLIASDIDKTTLLAKLKDGARSDMQKELSQTFDKKPESSIPDLMEVQNRLESKNIDVLYPQTEDKLSKNKFAQDFQQTYKEPEKEDKTVHLEVISNNNPQAAKLNRRHSYMSRGKTEEIEVGKIKNHGFSTMKELAQKVNEI